RCMVCKGGSLSSISFSPITTTTSGNFELPSQAVEDLNDLLENLKFVGIIAEVHLAQVGGTETTRECCKKTTGLGYTTSGAATGDFGGFSVTKKLWPPGPIPEANFNFNIAVFSVLAKADFIGGLFLGLTGDVSGQVGHRKSDCADDPNEVAGCFFANLSTTLT